LDEQLHRCNSKLIIRRGSFEDVLNELVEELTVCAVYWNKVYEPGLFEVDDRIQRSLRGRGIFVQSYNSRVLNDPLSIKNQQNQPYRVFTPFYKYCRKYHQEFSRRHYECYFPHSLPNLSREVVDDLDLLQPWGKSVIASWNPTREGGMARLRHFMEHSIANYKEGREFPAVDGTSKLSPYLHFGQISLHELISMVVESDLSEGVQNHFIRQIYWREFCYYTLFYFPYMTYQSLRPEFEQFPWEENADYIDAWKYGKTGVPIVDAAMRQLWQTGWMHNRLRMITGSFLVKDLLQHWQHGMAWFHDTLIDSDVACNSFGWQWLAGSGSDAAPYFRIFNPYKQSQQYDSNGEFLRAYLPELAALPDQWIHIPHLAPADILQKANITLGIDYPFPIVDHSEMRIRALSAYESIRERKI